MIPLSVAVLGFGPPAGAALPSGKLEPRPCFLLPQDRLEMWAMYKRGEPVIYRLTKASTRPGPRAQLVAPAPQGELYSYLVDKFWVVGDVMTDGRLLLRTRRGKERIIDRDDPNLRPARWWERILYRSRFPQSGDAPTEAGQRPKHRTAH